MQNNTKNLGENPAVVIAMLIISIASLIVGGIIYANYELVKNQKIIYKPAQSCLVLDDSNSQRENYTYFNGDAFSIL